jgi:aspartate aminotransferase
MELMILGTCGPAGSGENPLLLIDAAYTNYTAMASRLGRRTVSVTRILGEDGKFSLPSIAEIEEVVEREKPHAMVVIPYDNPTGHFYDMKTLKDLARICVRHDMWMISDEAYRELFYVDAEASSIWGITNSDVPGIEGRRISIETTSKVWNACGLRIGALITDSEGFHEKAVAENTADLCSSVIGQYIFGALAHESHENLKKWYEKQRSYYCEMMIRLTKEFHTILPGVIISSPDASIYSVVDVRNVVKPGFDAQEFVLYCAKKGKVSIDGEEVTLLVAPMAGFYSVGEGEANPGKTQMRIAYVETPENMAKVSKLFVELLHQYEESV